MGGWFNVRGLRCGSGGTLRGGTLGGGYVYGGVCWMLDTLRGYVGGREYVGGGGGVCWMLDTLRGYVGGREYVGGGGG